LGSVRIITFCLLALSAPASVTNAAGPFGGPHEACNYGSALLSSGDIRVLRDELYSRYYHAIDVFHRTINSSSPAFVWAKETKIACAKAIGYLKLGHFRREIDGETIWKCECFYARMTQYASRR